MYYTMHISPKWNGKEYDFAAGSNHKSWVCCYWKKVQKVTKEKKTDTCKNMCLLFAVNSAAAAHVRSNEKVHATKNWEPAQHRSYLRWKTRKGHKLYCHISTRYIYIVGKIGFSPIVSSFWNFCVDACEHIVLLHSFAHT